MRRGRTRAFERKSGRLAARGGRQGLAHGGTHGDDIHSDKPSFRKYGPFGPDANTLTKRREVVNRTAERYALSVSTVSASLVSSATIVALRKLRGGLVSVTTSAAPSRRAVMNAKSVNGTPIRLILPA